MFNQIAQAGDAAESLARSRQDAREAAVKAIRTAERALLSALRGETLKGMVNLATGNAPFYGARVRSDADRKLRWPAGASDGIASLCLAPSGRLVMVTCATDARGCCLDASVQPAYNTDLFAEDLAGVLRTLAYVLPRHTLHAEGAREKYLELTTFARTTQKVLDEWTQQEAT